MCVLSTIIRLAIMQLAIFSVSCHEVKTPFLTVQDVVSNGCHKVAYSIRQLLLGRRQVKEDEVKVY